MNSDELNSSSQNEAYPMMEDMEEDMVDMDDDEDDDDDLEDTDDMGGADGNMEDYAATRRSSPPAAAAAATRHIAARNLRGSSNNNRGGHGSNSCNVNRREVTTNHQPFTTRSSASNATFIPFEVEDSVIALATEEAAEESQTASFSGADSNARNDPATAKRRAIQAIMKDRMLTEREKGLRIHQLMDGRPTALSCLDRTNRGTGGHYNTVLSGLASDLGVDGDSDAAVASMVTPGLNEAMTCVHYERKCCVVAPCCNQVFGCRVCHDEMTPAPGHGQMDRFAIQEIVCKECKTRQTSKT